ncbi:MAG: CRISPR-associated endoribonuclease Cas6 [Candidatus Sigynarchaeota archaeon]
MIAGLQPFYTSATGVARPLSMRRRRRGERSNIATPNWTRHRGNAGVDRRPMRLVVTLEPAQSAAGGLVTKHAVQGFIYSALRATPYDVIHDKRQFKFFCFSDLFPIGDFVAGEPKTLVVSSPDAAFINLLRDALEQNPGTHLGGVQVRVAGIKVARPPLSSQFITGSPVVVYKDNKANMYFSFQKDKDMAFFLQRVKENALKKFNAFYEGELAFEGELFDRLVFRREVAVHDAKDGTPFIMIGSTWSLLAKDFMPPYLRKFYAFLMDCGLGEKNSLGFGFLNPVRQARS